MGARVGSFAQSWIGSDPDGGRSVGGHRLGCRSGVWFALALEATTSGDPRGAGKEGFSVPKKPLPKKEEHKEKGVKKETKREI